MLSFKIRLDVVKRAYSSWATIGAAHLSSTRRDQKAWRKIFRKTCPSLRCLSAVVRGKRMRAVRHTMNESKEREEELR